MLNIFPTSAGPIHKHNMTSTGAVKKEKERTADDVTALFKHLNTSGMTSKWALRTYDTLAQTYDSDLACIGASNYCTLAEHVSSILKSERNARILDVGAGTGLLAEQLHKQGFTNIDALDASTHMLTKAREKGLYKNIICTYLGVDRSPIQTDSYDAIVAVNCFDPGHITEDSFEELIRITKPGGRIVIMQRERYLTYPEFLNFEPTMQRHEERGLWRVVDRILAPYHGPENAFIYVFEPLPQ